jgi:hypothetical protein
VWVFAKSTHEFLQASLFSSSTGERWWLLTHLWWHKKHLRYPSGEHFLYQLFHQLNHLAEHLLPGTAVAVAIGADSLPTNYEEEDCYEKHSS